MTQNHDHDHQKQDVLQENLYALLGADQLRNIITQFYQEVFNDVMIGYLFLGQDRQRLIEREIEFSARMLGATDITYQGQPLTKAHQKHPIRYGHFHRRNQILLNTLKRLKINDQIIDFWMDHQQKLANAILGKADQDSSCNSTSQK
jgi:truncated hemoglobin YjbI